MIDDFGGDNLNPYQFIDFIDGNSAIELRNKIRTLRLSGLSFRILGFVTTGSNHYAWINPSRKIPGDLNELINKKRKKIKKDVDNGSN